MQSYRLPGFIAGASYLIFWYSYLIFLPVSQITTNYAAVVNSGCWFIVNVFQIVAIISFVQFYYAIRNALYKKKFNHDDYECHAINRFFLFHGYRIFGNFRLANYCKSKS